MIDTEIRVYMLRNQLSLRKLADALGISKAYVNQILIGERPAYAYRRRLVEELGFPENLVAYGTDKRAAA